MKQRFIPLLAAVVLLFQAGCGSSAVSTSDLSSTAPGSVTAPAEVTSPSAAPNVISDSVSADDSENPGIGDSQAESMSVAAGEAYDTSAAETARDPLTVNEICTEETDIYQMYGDQIYEQDGVLCADVDILAIPTYASADIDALQPGDTLEYCGELLPVTVVSPSDHNVCIRAGDEAITLKKSDTEPIVYTAVDMEDCYITYSIGTRTLKLTGETEIMTYVVKIWNDDCTSWEYGPLTGESEALSSDALADYLTENHSKYGQEAVIQLDQDTAVQIYLLFHP